MTNKDYMCTLDTATFAKVMHNLYYVGRLWIEGSDVKKMSTPTVFDVREWLDKPFDPDTDFWKCFKTH